MLHLPYTYETIHFPVSPTGLLHAQGIGTVELSTELTVIVHVCCVDHFQQQEMLYKIAVSLVMWMLRHEECAVGERSQGNNPPEGWQSGARAGEKSQDLCCRLCCAVN